VIIYLTQGETLSNPYSMWESMSLRWTQFVSAANPANYDMEIAFWISGGILLLITAILSEKLSGNWKVIGWIFFIGILTFYTYTGIGLNMRKNTEQKIAEGKANEKFDKVLDITMELLMYAKSSANNKDSKQLEIIEDRLNTLATEKHSKQSTDKVPMKRVALQLLSESQKNHVSRASPIAFEYSAFLENSEPTSSVKISVICIGYGLDNDTNPKWADCHLSNFYLKPLGQVLLKWEAYWSKAEEFMESLNTDKCRFLMSIKFYNEKNELIERTRPLGTMNKGSYPLPVLHAGYILY
jgi:hypothetical protein